MIVWEVFDWHPDWLRKQEDGAKKRLVHEIVEASKKTPAVKTEKPKG